MPIGDEQVSALVPIVSVAVLLGFACGLFRVDRRRLVLVSVLCGTAVLLTLLSLLAGQRPSLLSVLLLLVLYPPAVLTPVGDRSAQQAVARFFVRCMAIAAVLSLAQFGVQSAGMIWRDWLAVLVPPDLLLQEFNAGDPISAGSSITRTTALVFVEPSFLSLFLGVAVVFALQLRMRWPVITVLLLGVMPTLAGNGLVVVGAAVLVLLLRAGRTRLLALVPAAVLALAGAVLTPFGMLYLRRATEGGGSDSSTGLRFVQPYVQLIPPPLQDLTTALIGLGAGGAADYIARNFSEPLLATVLPKIVFEFGVIGVIGVLVPLAILLIAPLRRQPELVGLAFAFLVVNASLQAALMVYLVTLAMLWLPDLAGRPEVASRRDTARRDVPPMVASVSTV